MINLLLHFKWWRAVAIYLIAAQAGTAVVLAQNSVENLATQAPTQAPASALLQTPATADTQRSAQDAERQRITQLRDAADATYETAKQACYQKFAVNTCIAKAREKQRSEIIDLKRQEVALNDADRKRRGAEQLQRTEAKAKTSPEVQTQTAAQPDSALAATVLREKSQAGQAAVQQSAAQNTQQTAQVRSQNMQRKQAQAAQAAVQHRAAAAAKASQSKARYEERLKEAEEKRAKMQARKPTKPPAAGLPLPPSAP